MAVYKPSNCVPFLDTWDLTEEQNISFQVNTNNNIINGYKIRVLDNKNNLIFEGKEFSPINVSGIAYNGDVIVERLIIRNESNLNANTIYYDGKDYWVDGNTKKLENFSNGYVNQPYKWQIALAQGLLNEKGEIEQIPIDDKYWDMIVANGTIIGSVPNRIQGALSEYIYKDYFIQLVGEDKKTLIGGRGLIKSYDHTYGHILPQEGWFTQENIKEAFYFQIFKNTNQAEYIKTNRIVNNLTNKKMEEVEYDKKTSRWEFDKNTSERYIVQTYEEVLRSTADVAEGVSEGNANLLQTKYCKAGGPLVPNETLLLVKNEGNDGSSPLNGVFLFVSATWKRTAEGKTAELDKGTLTIKWMRPAMADTWAEFLGQSFFVLQTGENWDSNATSSGEINSTSLAFYPEKPIEIYPNAIDKTFGEIYKTNEPVPGKSETYRAYVRPFIGLEDGMRFKWVKYNQDGSYEDSGFIDYDKLDTERWCIEYNSTTKPDFEPDLDTYTFVSYFKISDENPFYGYSNPEVSIKSINDVDITDENFVVNDRIIDVIGTFTQDNNKMWRSFQWSLFDYNYGTTQNSGLKYSGEIRAQFVGLELGHQYELTLAIEDEMGRVNTDTLDFEVQNIELNSNVFENALQYAFDCGLHSVDVSLASEGIIKPGMEGSDLKCGPSVICSNTLICGQGGTGEKYYNRIYVGKDDLLIGGGLMEPSTGNITINFETEISIDDFNGSMLQVEIGDIKQSVELNESNDWISVETADLTYVEGNSNKTIVNPDRYKLYLKYKINEASNNVQSKEISIFKDDSGNLTLVNDGWVEKVPEVCFGYQPSSIVSEDYDYIVADLWEAEDKKTYKTLIKENGWESSYNYQSDYQGIPNVEPLADVSENTSAVWSDFILKKVKQPNDVSMQVLTDEYNIWNDLKEDGTPNIWYDEGNYQQYEQVLTNSTGRQRMKGKKFAFNIALKNYKYKKNVSVETVAQCVLKESNS